MSSGFNRVAGLYANMDDKYRATCSRIGCLELHLARIGKQVSVPLTCQEAFVERPLNLVCMLATAQRSQELQTHDYS